MALGRHKIARAQPQYRKDIATDGAIIARRGFARNEFCQFFDDFLGDAGQTAPNPWKFTKTGVSTNNTGDYLSAADGRFAMTHSADSEAQSMRLDWGDNLLVNMSKKPRLEVRALINFAGATFSADQRLVIGFASAFNATLDSIAHHAWFRIEGANLNILTESDDATTDDDDNDTGLDIVDNTMTVFEVDATSLSAVKFLVNGLSAGTLSMAALPANSLVQPFIAIQRDAGAELEVLTVDYAQVTWERT